MDSNLSLLPLGCLTLCLLKLLPAQAIPATQPTIATQQLAQIPTLPRQDTPSTSPIPTPNPQPLPTTPLPLPPAPSTPLPNPDLPENFQITVDRFEVRGSTVFSPQEFDAVLRPILQKRRLTLEDLFKARDAVSNLYTQGCNPETKPPKPCYINSGAYIPADQEFDPQKAVVVIQILEGSLETINVTGTRRLQPGYISSRIALATAPPLNRDRLLESIQLLRLDPLISRISAELAASPRPGKSILNLAVEENPTFHLPILLNNSRSPSVGSFRRGFQINQDNLLGLGDGLSVGYTNTDGSNALDFSYVVPLSPHNTTLSLSYGFTRSNVIEPPFDILGIESKSRYYELTLKQPIAQTLTQDFNLSFTFSRRESETALSFNDIGAFPLSPGADAKGRTNISALRFAQDYTVRSTQAVLAFRSQFSLGLDFLGATRNPAPPDSQFFAWRGQAQWVRLLGPDTALFLRADLQLADRPLLPSEQFGIGGIESVRGYRQDALLTDSGLFTSAELRVPILRLPKLRSTLQLTPFVEFGKGWNRGDRPDPNPDHLFSAGLGLRWRTSDRFEARFDWGIPLTPISSSKRTLQEQGLYFSILWNPF